MEQNLIINKTILYYKITKRLGEARLLPMAYQNVQEGI